MLFQMVEGHDLDGLLLKLVECIPWNALASAPKGDRLWFAFSTTSSQMTDSSPHQTTSSAALLLLQQTMSPTPSSTPPSAPQGLMNQNGAQTNMNMCPLQTSNQHTPQADGEVPMDTRPDAEHDSTVNESRDDAVNTSRLKRTSTSPRKALKKRQRRPGIMDHEDYMPSSDPSRETVLGHLLAAGESYSMPIDVEAVDMLMRNFPIIEEHQVRCAGYNSLKPYRIIF